MRYPKLEDLISRMRIKVETKKRPAGERVTASVAYGDLKTLVNLAEVAVTHAERMAARDDHDETVIDDVDQAEREAR